LKLTRKQKIAILAAAAGAVLVICGFWPAGPSYQGRSIRRWFYKPGQGDAEAFRAMGQAAVPFLIERLEDAPSEGIKSLLGGLSTDSKELYRQRKEMWQDRAAYLLGEMRAEALSAEPALTNAAVSENWALRGAATVALMKIREEPLDPLIGKLRDTSDYKAWYENAMMVGQFHSQADSAVPILLDALQNSNNIIQGHALIALGMIATQPEKCVPAITPFLSSLNVSDRQKAIGALIAFGTNALPAKKAIEGALNDTDPWVRNQAERAVKVLTESDSPEGRASTADPAVETNAPPGSPSN